MTQFDWSDLDVRLLQLLVAVAETGSVTLAAQRLGVTQSAVSHSLDKLRLIVGDPLFVKSGRGIVATACAQSLTTSARELLAMLERFARSSEFVPARWSGTFTIAADELVRDLLLPALASRLRVPAPGLALRLTDPLRPRAEDLRGDEYQLALSPTVPEGGDLVHHRLLEDHHCVYYDPRVRGAPRDLDDYLAASHATVMRERLNLSDLDRQLAETGLRRRFAAYLPSYAALAPFVQGTALLVTAPSVLSRTVLRGLATCPPPMSCPTVPLYGIWHLRYQQDAAHRWVRAELDMIAAPTLGAN